MACRPELRTLSKEQFWSRKFKLCILSTLFCISIASNNLSLPHIGLSVNQVLKSCTALPVLFLVDRLDRGWSRHRGTVGDPQCRRARCCTVDRLDARHRRQDVAECTADEGCEEGRTDSDRACVVRLHLLHLLTA